MKSIQCPSSGVLVLDGDMVPALSIVRSLGRKGLQITVGSHEDKAIAASSRFAKRSLKYPDPMKDGEGFVAWLKDLADREAYALIIPVTERTVAPIFRQRNVLADLPIALPENESLEIALDKSRTFKLASQLGIPVPQGLTVHDIRQLDSVFDTLQFPVVVKPARSMGSQAEGIIQLSVDYAFDRNSLIAKTRHALQYGDVILQEYFRGQGVGVELIADQGQVVHAFQHLRIHEIPLTGGGSSLRKSVPIEPALLEASKALMASLRWHGVAMIEFKWNPDERTYRLMEINGRFWGSLPLSIAAGSDFPAMLYELLAEASIQPRPPGREGVICRKLSSDLYWHELVLRGPGMPPGLNEPPSRRDLIKSLLLFLNPRHCFDVQSLSDPRPGMVDIGRILSGYGHRLREILYRRGLQRRQRAAWQHGKVSQELRNASRILFVCYGNINRSAIAQRCYEQRIAGQPLIRAKVLSAGFHEQAGRPADDNMIRVAGEHGLDMNGWSSRRLDQDMVNDADIIFVMEHAQLERMLSQYPEAAGKTFLLGLANFQMNPGGEIADPYGQPGKQYEDCFNKVCSCVDRLIAIQSSAQQMPAHSAA